MQKLAVLNTHPIQYFAPLYKRLAEEPELDLTVYFCSRQGADEYEDPGFGQRIKWDISLLDGYKHKFLRNLRGQDRVAGFWSLINPSILRELRQNRYDALLVNGHNHATYLFAMCAARALRIPVFMRCETHLRLHRSFLKRALREPLMKFLYNQICTACLPIGTDNRQFYLFHGVTADRLFTVPYAVDNSFFMNATGRYRTEEVRTELGLPLTKPIILFASKLIPRKRPMDLLRAFHLIQDKGIDATLIFVGSGQEEEALREYVQQHCIPGVYFFGFQNQSDLPKFYAVADLFVLPSENEPWGLIINEAMCAGLPIVAANQIGATTDLVRQKENGFTYDAGDVTTLTRYLSQILTAPAMREGMSAASLRIIAEWNYERCVCGIKQAMAHVLTKSLRLEDF